VGFQETFLKVNRAITSVHFFHPAVRNVAGMGKIVATILDMKSRLSPRDG
jgi:hypothetical protein